MGELKVNMKAQLSISEECALKVVTSGESYEIEGKKLTHTMKVPNGPLYLRILVSRIIINSRSNMSYISNTLSELDTIW